MSLVTHEPEILGEPERLLVLLHGYLNNERSMDAVPAMVDPEGRFRPISVRAPLETERQGAAAWYHRDDWGRIPAEQFLDSLRLLHRAVADACRRWDADPGGTVYFGVSQGCGLALAAALAADAPVRPAGAAGMAGVLPEVDGLDWAADLSDRPAVLIQHGTRDSHIPVDEAWRARDVLEAAGVKVEYHEYDVGHEFCPASMADLRAWLARI